MIAKQSIFALNVAKLIAYIIQDANYQVSLGEAYRTKEQAEIYAKAGKGIKDSIHCIRLGIDINIFKNGVQITKKENLSNIVTFWKAIHELNRWGGDFKRYYDYAHFSMEHNNVS